MYMRKDLMGKKCTHREYYSQFVNDNVKERVKSQIGIKRLQISNDEHFNDIPLIAWDNVGLPLGIRDLLKTHEDFFTMSIQTCILKEAGKQLIEELRVD